jgi:hypothetical protein
MKFWYQKKKITLQNKSISKIEGHMGETKEVLARNIISKSKVEYEADLAKAYK